MEMLAPEKVLVKIAAALEKLKIKYFITGGFAVSVWGRPRATFDIDIVVEIIEPQINPLIKALKNISPTGYADEEMIRNAFSQKGEFNFVDPEMDIKVDFWLTKKDEFSSSKFKRKKLKMINNQKVYFISPEDLILSKLEWQKESGSEQQLRDIESIFKISGKKLDIKYLHKWAKKLGVLKILNKIAK